MSKRSFKLMVAGSARHGKDTATERIAKKTGMTFGSSSMIACELFIFEQLAPTYGYSTPEQCWRDRLCSNEMRAIWFEAFKKYNTPDPIRLMKDIYKRHDIYSGIRSGEELAAGQEAGLIDLTLWIDADERRPIEPQTSMTARKDQADIIIQNNGTEAEFIAKLDRWIATLPKMQKPDVFAPVYQDRGKLTICYLCGHKQMGGSRCGSCGGCTADGPVYCAGCGNTYSVDAKHDCPGR